MQKYQNEPKINSFYSRNKLPKTKDGTYEINLDDYKSIGTHWITLYVNAENVTEFDIFGVEYIPKEIWKFIGTKIVTKIYRMQAYNSIMCGHFCIGFMLKGKSLSE